jgi:hypothetical protein
MEPEGTLPLSEELVAGTAPETDEFSPQLTILFLQDPF